MSKHATLCCRHWSRPSHDFGIVDCCSRGDVVAGVVLEGGRFKHADTIYVWEILAGSAVGLLASTMGRLYSSTYYALKDTRTPLRFAVIRVILTTVLGAFFALVLPKMLGVDMRLGAAGLTASAGIAGWVEFLLLRRKLNERIGSTGLPMAVSMKLYGAAMAGAAAAWGVKMAMGHHHPVMMALGVLPVYGAVYLAGTYLMGVGSLKTWLRRRTA